MARYFFNVYDGQNMPDTEGMELPDAASVRREAIRIAGAILEDEASRVGLGQDWRMEVTNDAGLMLFRLDFIVQESVAVHTQPS